MEIVLENGEVSEGLKTSENEKLSLLNIPQKGNYSKRASFERLEFLKEKTGAVLKNVADTLVDSEAVKNNVENFIGAVQIPVGVAGPLLIHREASSEYAYAPIATTEGALVASIVRGSKAISLCGGVTVRTCSQRMIRAPVFEFKNLSQAMSFAHWIRDNFKQIAEKSSEFSNFAKLGEVDVHLLGKIVHVRLIYQTGDAAGQNMTTTCTWNTCKWIVKQAAFYLGFEAESFHVEGNIATDKKVSALSTIEGRGIQAVAECCITRSVLKKILKIEPHEVAQLYHRTQSAQIFSGLHGSNVNISNVVAGIFAATGQDIACVHESSVGQLHMELKGEDLYLSLNMPSLIVGTVGGGVNLATQKELLELMGCYGKGKSRKLAENIVAFALALEISTACAITSDEFAGAHERLGRNRDCNWLKRAEINDHFFSELLAKSFQVSQATISKVNPIKNFEIGDSIITDAATKVTQRVCGLFPYEIDWQADDLESQKTRLLLKIKPLDEEVIHATELMAQTGDENLFNQVKTFRDRSPFKGCHTRELEVAKIKDPRFLNISPKTFGTHHDERREIYILAQELLEDMDLINSASNVNGWQDQHVRSAIKGIAGFHSIWFGKEAELNELAWLGYAHSSDSMSEMKEYWLSLATYAFEEFPHFFKISDLKKHQQIISEVSVWWKKLEEHPQCVIHNDFNPRNMAFRKNLKQEPALCAFDWELATKHVPQRDLAELLAFTLNDQTQEETVQAYIEFHRQELMAYLGASEKGLCDPAPWRLAYKYSLYDLLINRLSLYFVAHAHKHCDFLERTYRTLRHLIQIEEARGH